MTERLKVLVLVHGDLVPPENASKETIDKAPWRTEYDIVQALKKLGHEVQALGVYGSLEIIRRELVNFKPHIVFNLLEEFDGNHTFDQHVVSYLELKHVTYTGCNPRGLTLARDKALSKKILTYHRIRVPKFYVFPKGQKVRLPKKFEYPLIVKSLTEEASFGISQASIVQDEKSLRERIEFVHKNVDTDAIAEQYIEGREFYVSLLGNRRVTIMPIWELKLQGMPDSSSPIATERVKWDEKYRKKYRIRSSQATNLSNDEVNQIHKVCKKVYKALGLNGYARIDLRYTPDKKIYVIEANPNPGIAYQDEFPDSAERAGMSYNDVLSKILSLGISWYRTRY